MTAEDIILRHGGLTDVSAESTKKKRVWVLNLWQDYCRKMNFARQDVSGHNAKIFMRFLAKDCGYSKNSLKRVIGPNLRKENSEIGPDLR